MRSQTTCLISGSDTPPNGPLEFVELRLIDVTLALDGDGRRVWNRQPDGGFDGCGISPSSRMRSRSTSIVGSGIGTADNRACVYGCIGRSYSASRSAISTIRRVHHSDTI
ncbi:hypothetical protein AAFF_G00069760 [Aldrovandia affinis]|uniref:Uncharacterized protein n=1 Tax=Aldrovandia affinis TaxID=143900 RepID=A0AAD7R1R8_9TELE|nr:hypothetical protein AAFF_G00069760 [Aldrovandia affinis]